ncbi:hypothetical protein GJ496_006396 [Pomphorhynchus laevis]|nr:hypothetical protein GJ496_006396 [Pomphorhynchus laevis]
MDWRIVEMGKATRFVQELFKFRQTSSGGVFLTIPVNNQRQGAAEPATESGGSDHNNNTDVTRSNNASTTLPNKGHQIEGLIEERWLYRGQSQKATDRIKSRINIENNELRQYTICNKL